MRVERADEGLGLGLLGRGSGRSAGPQEARGGRSQAQGALAEGQGAPAEGQQAGEEHGAVGGERRHDVGRGGEIVAVP